MDILLQPYMARLSSLSVFQELPNKSIKFAHKIRGLGLGDKTRLAPYFKR